MKVQDDGCFSLPTMLKTPNAPLKPWDAWGGCLYGSLAAPSEFREGTLSARGFRRDTHRYRRAAADPRARARSTNVDQRGLKGHTEVTQKTLARNLGAVEATESEFQCADGGGAAIHAPPAVVSSSPRTRAKPGACVSVPAACPPERVVLSDAGSRSPPKKITKSLPTSQPMLSAPQIGRPVSQSASQQHHLVDSLAYLHRPAASKHLRHGASSLSHFPHAGSALKLPRRGVSYGAGHT